MILYQFSELVCQFFNSRPHPPYTTGIDPLPTNLAYRTRAQKALALVSLMQYHCRILITKRHLPIMDAYAFLCERLDLLERLICAQAEEILRLKDENESLMKAQAGTTGWLSQFESEVSTLMNKP